jgi:hypothetical protein
MKHLIITLLAGALVLSGCSDPEESARESLNALRADWDKARTGLDPEKRVKAYQAAVEDMENIISEYPETQVSSALSAGRSVDGLSLASLKGDLDGLAGRAECYAQPTADCLLPFASRGFRPTAAGSADQAVYEAAKRVCEKGYASADAALEGVKVNRPMYASNLMQVALHAAQCDRPDDVQAAISAYLSAEPAQGADRINKLMSILQTDKLRSAWADVLVLVEQEMPAAGLDPRSIAGNELTLAVIHAENGDADAALAKYRHVTDELGFNADVTLRINLASALITGGNTAAGMEIAKGDGSQDITMDVIHGAAASVGQRLGIIQPGRVTTANIRMAGVPGGSLDEFFAPVAAAEQQASGAIAGTIEAELDRFVAPRKPEGKWLGMSGAETTYGILALIQQKIGAADKAAALVKKAETTREALSRPGTYRPDSRSYLAEFQVLVALAQGRPDEGAGLYDRVERVGTDVGRLILVAFAKKGQAEEAMTFASRTNRGLNDYDMVIKELAANGHADKAEQVLNATPGNASAKSGMAWGMVERTAAAGDVERAEALAEKYQLLGNPGYRMRMLELKAEAAIADDDRGDAEKAIREMFAYGVELDSSAAQGRTRALNAQNAASVAFRAGYTDLGIELYRAASNKDQRPFFDAFKDKTDADDFPAILLTAHDNLRGEELGYVIDAAIRRIEQ